MEDIDYMGTEIVRVRRVECIFGLLSSPSTWLEHAIRRAKEGASPDIGNAGTCIGKKAGFKSCGIHLYSTREWHNTHMPHECDDFAGTSIPYFSLILSFLLSS